MCSEVDVEVSVRLLESISVLSPNQIDVEAGKRLEKEVHCVNRQMYIEVDVDVSVRLQENISVLGNDHTEV